jgi:hypothetical protein
MRLCIFALRLAAAAVALLVASAATADAQIYESVGVRAQGMGGAFVAVADDATATWMNTVDTIAIADPALGLSYYRLRISEIGPPASTASVPVDRQDLAAGEVRLRSLLLNQFGATVGQSVGNHLVLASTVKLLRGSLGVGFATGVNATLSNADNLGGSGETRVDLDVGAMVKFSHIKIGLAVKNLSQPTFGSGDNALQIQRQARTGIAFGTNSGSKAAGLTVAADADLTRTTTVVGDQRHIAAGVEVWSPAHWFTARGGVNANTVGAARPSASGGASLRLKSSAYVDAQKTFGSDLALQGWSVGLRVTF